MEAQPHKRIVFLDLMRFLALVMMIQGHTIYALIDRETWFHRDNWFFPGWEWLRGYTAPVFLIVAGTVFTYLLFQEGKPRIRKGIKRALVLLFFGYFLRFPFEVFVEEISPQRVSSALAVDVLHLIGVGLLQLCLLYWMSKGKLGSMSFWLLLTSTLILVFFPIAHNYDWANIFPEFLAAYLYSGTGSLFPLIPWLVYLLAGGMLGAWLSKVYGSLGSGPLGTNKAGIRLLGTGIFFVLLAELGDWVEIRAFGASYFWESSPNLVFHRLGMVLLIMGLVFFLSRRVPRVPYGVKILSKNTLWIYIAHLILLYNVLLPNTDLQLPLWGAILAVIVMLVLMLGLAWWIDRRLKYARWFQALN